MNKEVVNGSKLAEIRRRVIDELWERVFREGGFRGRTWGLRGRGVKGEYAGTHILLGSAEGEIVILAEKDGKIVIHEFEKTTGTELGKRIRNLLDEKGFSNEVL